MSRSSTRILGLCVALLAWASSAPAQTSAGGRRGVPVRVVDVADSHAFVEPGSAAGLTVGDEVRFAGERYKISAVSSSFAVVALREKSLSVGARGLASAASGGEAAKVATLPPVTTLPELRREWRPAVLPALKQRPTFVPLGGARSGQRARSKVTLTDALYGVIPLGDQPEFVGNELEARVHYEVSSDTPLSVDLDVALQTFGGDGFASRPGSVARQLWRVRELSLTYGNAGNFRGALGRLRAASTLVGQLDGLRLEAPLLPELSVRVHGGAVPHSLSGALSSRVTRFGGEMIYRDLDATFRPQIVAGAYASTFGGSLDEKRAYATFDLSPPAGRLGGHALVSLFEPDNPWRAGTVELSSAGLDAAVDVEPFYCGGRAELHRPERSRWLASLLPAEWLCWSSPARASAPCAPGDAMYSWQLNGGVRAGRVTVDLGGHSAFTVGTDASTFGGFANLRWLGLVRTLHLDAGMSVLAGSVLRSVSANLSPGVTFAGGRGDFTARYRPALVRYRATLRSTIEHAVGAGLWLSPVDSLDIDVEGDWLATPELDAFVVQATAAWTLGI